MQPIATVWYCLLCGVVGLLKNRRVISSFLIAVVAMLHVGGSESLLHVDCGCIACVLCSVAWLILISLVQPACICAYRSWLLSWKRLQ